MHPLAGVFVTMLQQIPLNVHSIRWPAVANYQPV